MEYPRGVRADGLPAVLSDPDRLAALAASGQFGSAPEQVFDDLTRLAVSVTGCAISAITFVGTERTYWKSVPHLAYTGRETWQNGVGESFCYFPIGMDGPVIIDDAANDPRVKGHQAIEPWGVGAWAGFPIMTADGHAIGTMCVIDTNPRQWRTDELETLAILARAVSNEVNLRIALANARTALDTAQEALARTGELSRSLQESLLPPVLLPPPGLDAAARYLTATGDASVGGDFYDLFQARGPWWSAVLGDVCGKGTEAAKVTALARYTLRADAGEHLSPASVLRRLNTAMLAQRAPRFLTAVQATFRATAAGLAGRLCLAGHPPALIRRADGRVQPVGVPGVLLGVAETVRVTDVRFRMAPGDLMLLYTDGACEARADRRGPEPGKAMFDEEALARALAASHGLDAAGTVEHLAATLSAYHHGWHSDDAALLALRVPAHP
ncbi:SpoIIE family protein phosphatase [Actinoplanes awajinensis]|uniref:Serine/threonine protein phosphatase n=1 Tax=Actinoplanes awajinensis subsp. mycoplanecinus TaxID=135947 RepID=A0A0X3V2R3_9ACTN|nr:GAF domain-containing SpoIIE family protein phosphatase [Actinoplanes awajinensis]KUL37526.1 serine/threonine protein phosphatase [Actinoplanes awajinensis subsp. mycoplanecinus]